MVKLTHNFKGEIFEVYRNLKGRNNMKQFKLTFRAGKKSFALVIDAKDMKEVEEKVKREYSIYGPVTIVSRLTLR